MFISFVFLLLPPAQLLHSPCPQYPVARQWKERVYSLCLNLFCFIFSYVLGWSSVLSLFGLYVFCSAHTHTHTHPFHPPTHTHTHTQTDRPIEPAGTSITISFACMFVNPITNLRLILFWIWFVFDSIWFDFLLIDGTLYVAYQYLALTHPLTHSFIHSYY